MKYKIIPQRRRWIRWLTAWLLSFSLVVIGVPAILVITTSSQEIASSEKSPGHESDEENQEDSILTVAVHLTGEDRVVELPIEQYVRGVVAAEMPVEFELEALKAQALAARTYIVHRLQAGSAAGLTSDVQASVTDSIVHQAYIGDEELKQKWPAEQAAQYFSKLQKAVEETKGQIITYEGQPIQALFFSTSSGNTINSEDYWGQPYPYLRSVPSPWDKQLSPHYKDAVTISARELRRKLGLGGTAQGVAAVSLKVLSTSKTGAVLELSAAGHKMTGREFREKLGLKSTHFSWRWSGGELTITTEGYGHGVGMSQWGANGLAKEGKSAEEIVKYYYQGIEIEPLKRQEGI